MTCVIARLSHVLMHRRRGIQPKGSSVKERLSTRRFSCQEPGRHPHGHNDACVLTFFAFSLFCSSPSLVSRRSKASYHEVEGT